MLIVDGRGAVRVCGESLARLLGRRADELAGRPVWALLPDWNPYDLTHVDCGLRLPAMSASIPVRVSCEALHVPNDTLFMLELHRLSRVAAACEADAIMVTDRGGEILQVNRAFETMTGFRRAELVGRTPAILKSGEHDVGVYRDLWDTILGGDVYRGVLVNRRKDGELYHEEKVIRPVPDGEGRPTLFFCAGRDVTAWVPQEPMAEACAAL